ncbi:putative GTPase activator protein [Babesia divergens]|uniref:GTPase activator protein n=1 Tax=Babesia divergens TaxID=32595 RepID=A0AAD9LLK0_BABDI|nr:putative GTPase activator protein [Babesia divergens]
MVENVSSRSGSTLSSKKEFINGFLSIGEPCSPLRHEKWVSMRNRGLAAFAKAHWNTLLRRTNRGIPQEFRWESWKVALKFDHYLPIVSSDYEELACKTNEYSTLIQIDVPRTFPELKIFDDEIQQQLSRILVAYSNYHPEIGYCQGMNFVAGLLLLVSGFDELETYVGFVGLMNELGLADFYMPTFPLIQKYIQAFDTITQKMWPGLHRHFQKEEISAAVFLHQWFLTMFVVILPLRTVVTLWDYILFTGLSSVMSVSFGLLHLLMPQMRQLKFEGIMGLLKHIKDTDLKDDIRVGRIIVNQAYRIALNHGSFDPFIMSQEDASTNAPPKLDSVRSASAPMENFVQRDMPSIPTNRDTKSKFDDPSHKGTVRPDA